MSVLFRIKKYVGSFIFLIILYSSCTSSSESNNIGDSLLIVKNRIELYPTVNPTSIETTKDFSIRSTETKGPEKHTTFILDESIEIIILKTYLSNYIDQRDYRLNFKYRDVQIKLVIKQNSLILLDTIFSRKEFKRQISNDYFNTSFLQLYRFDEFNENDNTIVFSGEIGVDQYGSNGYSFRFYHLFDLKNKKLGFRENQDDEYEGSADEDEGVTDTLIRKDSLNIKDSI